MGRQGGLHAVPEPGQRQTVLRGCSGPASVTAVNLLLGAHEERHPGQVEIEIENAEVDRAHGRDAAPETLSGLTGCVILWLWPYGILLDLHRLQGSQCIDAMQHFYVAMQQEPRHILAGTGADEPVLSSLNVMFPRLLNKAAVASRRRGLGGRPAGYGSVAILSYDL